MKNEHNVFTSPGLASIVILKQKMFSVFKTVPEDRNDDDDDDVSMQRFASSIKEEIKK